MEKLTTQPKQKGVNAWIDWMISLPEDQFEQEMRFDNRGTNCQDENNLGKVARKLTKEEIEYMMSL